MAFWVLQGDAYANIVRFIISKQKTVGIGSDILENRSDHLMLEIFKGVAKRRQKANKYLTV